MIIYDVVNIIWVRNGIVQKILHVETKAVPIVAPAVALAPAPAPAPAPVIKPKLKVSKVTFAPVAKLPKPAPASLTIAVLPPTTCTPL